MSGNNETTKVWHNLVDTDITVMERANELLHGWSSAQSCREPQDHNGLRAEEVVKCNVDTSFSTSQNKVGIDICLRDDKGQFVLAGTLWLTPYIDVEKG